MSEIFRLSLILQLFKYNCRTVKNNCVIDHGNFNVVSVLEISFEFWSIYAISTCKTKTTQKLFRFFLYLIRHIRRVNEES